MNTEIMMNFIMGATGITLVVLIWLAYLMMKTKRTLEKQIEYENSNTSY